MLIYLSLISLCDIFFSPKPHLMWSPFPIILFKPKAFRLPSTLYPFHCTALSGPTSASSTASTPIPSEESISEEDESVLSDNQTTPRYHGSITRHAYQFQNLFGHTEYMRKMVLKTSLCSFVS